MSESIKGDETSTDKQTQDLDNDIEKQNEVIFSQPPPYTAFSNGRRRLILFVVTIAGFLGPLAGNIYIPILPFLKDDFKVSQKTINGTVSVFMGVCALTPLLWAALADVGGRKCLYLVSLAVFLLANVLLTFLPAHIASLYVLRVVQAVGSSSVLSVGAGTVADITPPRDRGKKIAIFMLGPQLGPLLGPILSAVASKGQWRWTFGLLSIITVVVYLIILFLLPETLRCLVGRGESYAGKSWVIKPRLYQKRLISDTEEFPKPPKLSPMIYVKLAKYYPVLICSSTGGMLFASFYGVAITFAEILASSYDFSQLATSFSYVAPGLALIAGSLTSGYLSDSYRKASTKKGKKVIPENRFPQQVLGYICAIAGLTGYGWTCQKQSHVVAVFATVCLVSFGVSWVMVTNTTYLTECASGIPASNVAFGTLMRNSGAAISAGIVRILAKRMGLGWCFTGLAFVNIIGLFLMVLLFFKGKFWREKYGYLTK